MTARLAVVEHRGASGKAGVVDFLWGTGSPFFQSLFDFLFVVYVYECHYVNPTGSLRGLRLGIGAFLLNSALSLSRLARSTGTAVPFGSRIEM